MQLTGRGWGVGGGGNKWEGWEGGGNGWEGWERCSGEVVDVQHRRETPSIFFFSLSKFPFLA